MPFIANSSDKSPGMTVDRPIRTGPRLTPPTQRPLKIAIIGAGLGGLSAAIGLRREGHHVELFEQSQGANEVGAAIHLPPNSNGVLRRWGIMAEEFGGTNMERLQQFHADGSMFMQADMRAPNSRWQHPWHLVHRRSLHRALVVAATETGTASENPPAVLRTSSQVVGVNPDQGIIELENGDVFEADVVLGADGIYSKSRKFLTGHDPKLHSSGKAIFRFLLPRQVALDDPVTRDAVKNDGCMNIWYGDDRRVVMYPAENDTLLNFACIHPDSEYSARPGDAWNKQASVEHALQVYQDFDPALRALISKVPEGELKVWRIMDMKPLESWTRGKLALLGDAAHPFTPHQGQGAGQAIEDASTLATVLGRGTCPSDVPKLLELYETMRRTRAHAIQEFSRLAGKDWVGGKPAIDMQAFTNQNFGHDEIDHSRHIMRQWEAEQRGQHYWPIPAVVALPRRTRWGRPGCKAAVAAAWPARERAVDPPVGSRTVTTITFKTSRTYLETLFPTDALRFEKADTVCHASIVAIQPSQAGQGVGYQLSLRIHGVQCRRSDGTWVSGIYVPVVFEQSPFGDGVKVENHIPRIRCAINTELDCTIKREIVGQSLRLTASIGNAVFAQVLATDLAYCKTSEYTHQSAINESMHMTFCHVAGRKRAGGQDVILKLSNPFSESLSSPLPWAQTARHAEFWFSSRGLMEDRFSSSSSSSSSSKAEIPPGLLATIDALQQMPIYGIDGAHVVTGWGQLAFRAFEQI